MSDEVSTAMRYLKMLASVPRLPRSITVRALHALLAADGYTVSLRTVQRDLINLSVRFAITDTGTLGPQGNVWSWQETADFIDLPGIDPSTAVALLLSQKYLEPILPAGVTHRLQPYFKRSEAVLSGMEAHALRRWRDKVRVLPRGLELATPKIGRSVQEAVYEALLVNRQIDARYRARGKEGHSEIVLNPLGIVLKDGITYLVATAWDYTDLRHYPLHRFVSARVLDASVRLPAGFSLDTYIAGQKAFSYPESPGQIALEIAVHRDVSEHLIERPIAGDQKIGPYAGDRVLLTATVADTAELRWWLLGFGDRVEVLSPRPLRDEFRQIVKTMADRYTSRVRKSGRVS